MLCARYLNLPMDITLGYNAFPPTNTPLRCRGPAGSWDARLYPTWNSYPLPWGASDNYATPITDHLEFGRPGFPAGNILRLLKHGRLVNPNPLASLVKMPWTMVRDLLLLQVL